MRRAVEIVKDNSADATDAESESRRVFAQLSTEPLCAVPYASLREWTGNFNAAAPADGPYGRIGQGAFGEVFKGLALPPKETAPNAVVAIRLAVKRMDLRTFQLGVADGPLESVVASFRREINVLSRFRHPNVVRLIGYSEPCVERREPPCLVYELLTLGSLADQLTDDSRAALLTWQTRVDVLTQISTALNYLHSHNPGNPAYHRDIKASNIALTSDYTAKLIDCGLSKYVAEDGKGQSILSATTGRFGTPGYMCPNYCKGRPYDAKSEVYSFGIVVLEVLTGRLQGVGGVMLEEAAGVTLGASQCSSTADSADDEQPLPVDRRAGEWSAECVQQLAALAKECTDEHRRRVKSMVLVMRRLRQTKSDCCPLSSSAEAVYQQRMAQLVTENEAMRLARDVAVAVSEERECQICFDTGVGIACRGSDRHFVCKSCVSTMVTTQCNDFGGFTGHGRHIVCSFPSCNSKYPEEVICRSCDSAALNAYMAAKEAAVRAEEESRTAGQLEEINRRHADEMMALEARLLSCEADKRAKNVQRHRLRIINDVIETRCPHCSLTFSSWDGCFAVQHRGELQLASGVTKTFGCLKHFCGWCLGPFPDSASCHEHTKACHLNQHPRFRGSYSGDMAEFHRVQASIRTEKIQSYLQTHVRDASEREALLAAMRSADLAPLGIRL